MRVLTAVMFFVLGVLVVPAVAWVYLNHGHPPVAVADPSFPMEQQIVSRPLHERIQAEMPASSPVPVNAQTLAGGATVYMQQCAFCHGVPGVESKVGANMYPDAPQLWVKHHHGDVVGVSDDPVGETYWRVKNGIRLTGMPSYVKLLTDEQMWQVSNLLSVADKPLPTDVQAILAQPVSR